MKINDELPEIRQELNLLYDFYGAALTRRQAEAFPMRILEDCSLTEIAKEMGVGPQAVVDTINRSIIKLRNLDKKMGLIQKHKDQQMQIAAIQIKLDELEQQINPTEEIAAQISWIRKAVGRII